LLIGLLNELEQLPAPVAVTEDKPLLTERTTETRD
jgi:hypothetical protein